MLSLNVRTPVPRNNHASHRVQDPSLIRISQQRACTRLKTTNTLSTTLDLVIEGPTLNTVCDKPCGISFSDDPLSYPKTH